jgi:hypothetical protein
LTYLDVHASGALKDGGVEVSALIDDAHPSPRAKDPGGLAQGPGAFFAVPDVTEGQVAEHHVEGPGGQGEVPCIGMHEFDAFADALHHRVALGGGLAVTRLVTQTPDVDSGRAALRQPAGCRDEHGTPATADVEHLLVAPQVEFIEQFFPDRQLARTGAVEVARSDSERGYGPYLGQRAEKALVSLLRPPVTGQKTCSDQEEDRNAAVASIDAVPGSITPHLDECASYRSRSSMSPGGIVISTVRTAQATERTG